MLIEILIIGIVLSLFLYFVFMIPIKRKELKTRIVALEYIIHYLDDKVS